MKKVFIFFTFILILSLNAQVEKQKYTIYDHLILTTIGDVRFSPDGLDIACIIGDKEKWDGTRTNNIWIYKTDGSTKYQLTNSLKGNWRPRWSPDGTQIAFLSGRAGKAQIYIIDTRGGEARQFTSVKTGVRMFEWVNNKQLAFVSHAPRDTNLVKREEKAGGGYVVGTKYRKSELWIQSLKENAEARKVTGGQYHISELSPAPNGQRFAMVIASDSELYKQITGSQILVIDGDGAAVFRFEGGKGFANISFSPDGNKISFSGNIVGFSSNSALFVADLTSGTTVNLTKEFEPTIGSINWLNGVALAFSTPRNVYTGIYRVSLDGKIDTLVEPYRVIYSYAIDIKTNKIVYAGSRSNVPNDIYVQRLGVDPADAEGVTGLNDWVKEKILAETKVVSFPAPDGASIEAVVALPPGYSAEKKYPLLVMPHGGPDGIVMDNFHIFHQLFALEGIIVYRPNFRGGIGYGNDLYEANRGKLGYIDYDDIMAGLEFLIKTESVDTAKLLVGGWSYGGYMTNWMIGQTDRFKAAVSVAGIANTVSMYAQSDINHGELARWEFKGVPVLDMENYTRSSPLTFLKNAKTPTLIIHGEADDRVPVAQAWEIYRALVDLNVTTELVLYPDAHHGIRPPKQFSDVINRWIAWYKKYIGG